MRRRTVLLVIAASVLVLASCGSDGDNNAVVIEGEGTSGNNDGADGSDASAADDGGSTDDDTKGDAATPAASADSIKAVNDVIVGDVPPEVEDCVASAAAAERDLLAAVNSLPVGGEVTDLTAEQQVRLYEITLDCAGPDLLGDYLAQGFTESSGGLDAPPELIECLTAEMTGEQGPVVVAGMVAIGNDVPPPPEARDPLVDTLTECVPASYLGSVMAAEITDDPALAGAVDVACIDTGYTDNSITRPLWEALVDDPDAELEELPPETLTTVFSPFFDCISFGQVVAGELTTSGVTLSQTSIDCIDTEMMALGVFDQFLAGQEPSEDELGLVLLGCLSAEELAQLAGG